MKLAALPTVFYLTYFYHKINQVLYAEETVVEHWVLLIDSFHEEPVLINYLLVISIEPEITAHHETLEEFLLEFRDLTYMETDISQVLHCLTIHSCMREPWKKIEEKSEEVILILFVLDVRTAWEDLNDELQILIHYCIQLQLYKI